MIELKQLINRIYDDKMCTSFVVRVSNQENDRKLFDVCFEKTPLEELPENYPVDWMVTVLLDRQHTIGDQVYRYGLSLPRKDMPLTVIASMGLRKLRDDMKYEVQMKAMYDMLLGAIVEGT